MNTDTGKLIQVDTTATPPPGYVLVTRKLTPKERSEMQIRLYSPCGCGSGRKFKFCCHTKGKS